MLTAAVQCAVNVTSLVTLESVQRELGLGPNGGLVYCMEYVTANVDWLAAQLAPLLASGTYLLFDCPGQVELFNVHDALQKLVAHLTDKLGIRCGSRRRARACCPARRSRAHCSLRQADVRAPGG